MLIRVCYYIRIIIFAMELTRDARRGKAATWQTIERSKQQERLCLVRSLSLSRWFGGDGCLPESQPANCIGGGQRERLQFFYHSLCAPLLLLPPLLMLLLL